MKTNQKGLDVIKSFEGLYLRAYLCPAKVWTIGYGTTTNVKAGMTISREQAEAFLKDDLAKFERSVLRLVKQPLTDNQFSALVSFCYNVGAGNLEKSTLLKKVNINPKDKLIYNEFLKWNKAKGKVLSGLTRRRKAEADLYFTE